MRGLVGLVAYEVVSAVLLFLLSGGGGDAMLGAWGDIVYGVVGDGEPMSWRHLGWLLALFDLWLPLSVVSAVGLLYVYEYAYYALMLTPAQRARYECPLSQQGLYGYRHNDLPGCTCLDALPPAQAMLPPKPAVPPEPAVLCIHWHAYPCDDCRGFWDPDGRRL